MRVLLPLLSSLAASSSNTDATITKSIALDHIVYVVPDLYLAMDDLEHRLGVHPTFVGRHLALGTHNALLGLGEGRYLELFAQDPEAEVDLQPLIGVDGRLPRISTFCCDAQAVGIDNLTKKLQDHPSSALFPGAATAGTRKNTDGSVVSWRVAVDKHAQGSDNLPMGGLLPFLIEWDEICKDTRPAATAPPGCRLKRLVGYHPEPSKLTELLTSMGAQDVLDVKEGDAPELVLEIETPDKGVIELE